MSVDDKVIGSHNIACHGYYKATREHLRDEIIEDEIGELKECQLVQPRNAIVCVFESGKTKVICPNLMKRGDCNRKSPNENYWLKRAKCPYDVKPQKED